MYSQDQTIKNAFGFPKSKNIDEELFREAFEEAVIEKTAEKSGISKIAGRGFSIVSGIAKKLLKGIVFVGTLSLSAYVAANWGNISVLINETAEKVIKFVERKFGEKIANIFRWVWSKIQMIFNWVFNTAKTIFNYIKEGFEKIVGAVKGFFEK